MRETRPDEAPGESAARAAAEERARRLEVEFLEGVRARLPDHPAVVESLGCLYTEMGRYQDGLRADREMVRMELCETVDSPDALDAEILALRRALPGHAIEAGDATQAA